MPKSSLKTPEPPPSSATVTMAVIFFVSCFRPLKNTDWPVPQGVFERYAKDGAELVMLDSDQRADLEDMGISCIEAKLIEIKKGYIRHDAELVSKAVVDIAIKEKTKNQ